MLISSSGTLVRTPVSDISIQGRNTQGVRLIRLDEGDRLVGMERIIAENAAEGDNGVDQNGVDSNGDSNGDESADEGGEPA